MESKIDIKDKELQNSTLSEFAIQERDDKLEYMQKEIDKLEKEILNLNKLLQSREKDINERDNKINSMEMNDKYSIMLSTMNRDDNEKRSFLEDPDFDNANLEIKLNNMQYDTTSPDFEVLEEKYNETLSALEEKEDEINELTIKLEATLAENAE